MHSCMDDAEACARARQRSKRRRGGWQRAGPAWKGNGPWRREQRRRLSYPVPGHHELKAGLKAEASGSGNPVTCRVVPGARGGRVRRRARQAGPPGDTPLTATPATFAHPHWRIPARAALGRSGGAGPGAASRSFREAPWLEGASSGMPAKPAAGVPKAAVRSLLRDGEGRRSAAEDLFRHGELAIEQQRHGMGSCDQHFLCAQPFGAILSPHRAAREEQERQGGCEGEDQEAVTEGWGTAGRWGGCSRCRAWPGAVELPEFRYHSRGRPRLRVPILQKVRNS